MTLTREVLVIVPVPDDALGRIAAVDRCLHVVDARGWFDVDFNLAVRRHKLIDAIERSSATGRAVKVDA